jgi:hypothetical protein
MTIEITECPLFGPSGHSKIDDERYETSETISQLLPEPRLEERLFASL